MKTLLLAATFAAALAAAPAFAADPAGAKDDDTYDQDSILKDATEFF